MDRICSLKTLLCITVPEDPQWETITGESYKNNFLYLPPLETFTCLSITLLWLTVSHESSELWLNIEFFFHLNWNVKCLIQLQICHTKVMKRILFSCKDLPDKVLKLKHFTTFKIYTACYESKSPVQGVFLRWPWALTALQLKRTHAKRRNTSKLRKHLHQFDNTCAAFREHAAKTTTQHIRKPHCK